MDEEAAGRFDHVGPELRVIGYERRQRIFVVQPSFCHYVPAAVVCALPDAADFLSHLIRFNTRHAPDGAFVHIAKVKDTIHHFEQVAGVLSFQELLHGRVGVFVEGDAGLSERVRPMKLT